MLGRAALTLFVTHFLILAHPSHLLHICHLPRRSWLYIVRNCSIPSLDLAIKARTELAKVFGTYYLRKYIRIAHSQFR